MYALHAFQGILCRAGCGQVSWTEHPLVEAISWFPFIQKGPRPRAPRLLRAVKPGTAKWKRSVDSHQKRAPASRSDGNAGAPGEK